MTSYALRKELQILIVALGSWALSLYLRPLFDTPIKLLPHWTTYTFSNPTGSFLSQSLQMLFLLLKFIFSYHHLHIHIDGTNSSHTFNFGINVLFTEWLSDLPDWGLIGLFSHTASVTFILCRTLSVFLVIMPPPVDWKSHESKCQVCFVHQCISSTYKGFFHCRSSKYIYCMNE